MHKPIDMRAFTYDTDRHERLIQLIISEVKQGRTGDTVSAGRANIPLRTEVGQAWNKEERARLTT